MEQYVSDASSKSPPKARIYDGVNNHQSESHYLNVKMKSTPRKARALRHRKNVILAFIAVLAICSVIFSLSIGHYHHSQNADGVSYVTSWSLLESKLQNFRGDIGSDNSKKSSGIVATHERSESSKGREDFDPTHERSVFESIIERVQWAQNQCSQLTSEHINTVKKTLKAATDLPMLEEGGVASALREWLRENPSSTTDDIDYPTCYLPPSKSCNATAYTLIIMSHTTERLQTFMDPLRSMVDLWPGLTEVIIVWNSPRETLLNAANNGSSDGKRVSATEQKYATELLQWNEDQSHPLRMFYSLENGLANNLLNRYHPKLNPKNEAVMYFDDDGPFWSKEAMVYGGFELWKRNSRVQVGGFPRNVRFLSNRMKQLEAKNLQQSIDIVVRDADDYSGESHPTFTPICRNVTGDHVEYNFFTFPDFAGHVLLPSGTFLHRNYLCFIWHPALEELRKWVITHKTMPDDMTVSTLISHLSGRAPRTFAREVSVSTRRRLGMIDLPLQNMSMAENRLQSPQPDQMHRRLLWKQKNWGGMREEAINSILGYFGSVHPGTVGWCAGTPYMKNNNRGVPFVCHPEKPTLDLVPWLAEGGTGSNQCPLDTEIVKQTMILEAQRHAMDQLPFEGFCQECKYKSMGITCRQRMQFLIDNYKTDPGEAKAAVIKEDENCKES